mmetsp:Transcript_10648/g.17896  ORF Transcript_10648/g.17896 Transcript_10648/m.17896 type:complete len:173 (+) Transcript_10648:1096-1614(+)
MRIRETVTETFTTQLQEYMTSVDTTPAMGVDRNFGASFKGMHNRIDRLIETIDSLSKNTKQFLDQYDKQLTEKDKFYKDQDKFSKERQESDSLEGTSVDPNLKLDDKTLEDIKYGVENLRTTLKEKYLGRSLGSKRGETNANYASGYLTIVFSGIMMIILVKVVSPPQSKFA